MPVAEVTVAYVNDPKGNAKSGSIKDTNDIYYSVWPEKLENYAVGSTYTVEYEENLGKDGRVYKTVKKSTADNAEKVAAQVSHARNALAPAPASTMSRVPHDTALEIFVTGVIGRAHHGTGIVPDRQATESMVRSLRAGWKAGFDDSKVDAQEAAMPDVELDDEVPF